MTWFDSFDDFDEGCKDGFRMGNGHYLPGTRKCSVCKDFKDKADFNKEQAAKPATKRICNDCGAPLPSDLNQLTVEALKNELRKRKVPIPKGNKSVLITTLSLAVGNQPPPPPPPPPPPKPPSQPPLPETHEIFYESTCADMGNHDSGYCIVLTNESKLRYDRTIYRPQRGCNYKLLEVIPDHMVYHLYPVLMALEKTIGRGLDVNQKVVDADLRAQMLHDYFNKVAGAKKQQDILDAKKQKVGVQPPSAKRKLDTITKTNTNTNTNTNTLLNNNKAKASKSEHKKEEKEIKKKVEEGDKTRPCAHCSKMFGDKNALRMHSEAKHMHKEAKHKDEETPNQGKEAPKPKPNLKQEVPNPKPNLEQEVTTPKPNLQSINVP